MFFRLLVFEPLAVKLLFIVAAPQVRLMIVEVLVVILVFVIVLVVKALIAQLLVAEVLVANVLAFNLLFHNLFHFFFVLKIPKDFLITQWFFFLRNLEPRIFFGGR